MKRKIIEITQGDYYIVVRCEDNTLWRGSGQPSDVSQVFWEKLPDIPQDDN